MVTRRLAEHDGEAVAADHAEIGGLAPETIVVEAQLVAVVPGGGDDVFDE